MAAWYTIVAIESDEPREWSSQEGGKFESWRVTLRNAEGREKSNIEINKKPGNKPRLNSENYGELIDKGEHGFQFKYAKTADGSPAVKGGGSGGGGSASNGSAGGGGSYWAPEDLAAVRRTHALEFAAGILGPILPETSDDDYRLTMMGWVRFFEESVENAAKNAEGDVAQDEYQPPEPVPAGGGEDTPPPADDDIPF